MYKQFIFAIDSKTIAIIHTVEEWEDMVANTWTADTMTMMTCILQDLATTTTTTTEDPTFNEEFGHHMAGAMMIMIGHTTIIDITKVDRVIHQENGPDIAMH